MTPIVVIDPDETIHVTVDMSGPPGDPGAMGSAGKTILSGEGVPNSAYGANGDFYIDKVAWDIYGPKASGTWGAATSLIGPSGIASTGIPRTDLANDVQSDLTRTKGYVSWGEMAGTKTWQEIYDNNLTWAQAANMTWGEFFGLTTWQRVYDAYVSWDQASSNNWGAL